MILDKITLFLPTVRYTQVYQFWEGSILSGKESALLLQETKVLICQIMSGNSEGSDE